MNTVIISIHSNDGHTRVARSDSSIASSGDVAIIPGANVPELLAECLRVVFEKVPELEDSTVVKLHSMYSLMLMLPDDDTDEENISVAGGRQARVLDVELPNHDEIIAEGERLLRRFHPSLAHEVFDALPDATERARQRGLGD